MTAARAGVRPADSARTQPLPQPVDQACKAVGGNVVLAHRQADLPLCQAFGNQHMDGRGFKPEVGFEATAKPIEAQGNQARDMLRITAGRGEPKIKRQNIAIDTEQQQT